MQVPSWPATLHDWQAPEQDATTQHTPSTQKPDPQVDAVAAVQPSPLPRLATLYSQVWLTSAFAKSLGDKFWFAKSPGRLPPKSTITARWLSKTMVGAVAILGPMGKLRRYQVAFLASSSQVLRVAVAPGAVALVAVTCRRRRLS